MLRIKSAKREREKNKEIDKELRIAWAAISAAGVVSSAQYEIGIFHGRSRNHCIETLWATSSVSGLALFDLLGTDDVIKTAEDGALY